MSRRYPTEVRQRREHLKRCIRCDTKLHGGTGSNIEWYQTGTGKWKASVLCKDCVTSPP